MVEHAEARQHFAAELALELAGVEARCGAGPDHDGDEVVGDAELVDQPGDQQAIGHRPGVVRDHHRQRTRAAAELLGATRQQGGQRGRAVGRLDRGQEGRVRIGQGLRVARQDDGRCEAALIELEVEAALAIGQADGAHVPDRAQERSGSNGGIGAAD